MLRTVFAIAVAGLIFAAVSGTAQAAPAAPLSAGVTSDLSNLTDVQWGRNCWRDRWGRVHCRGGGWGPGWGGPGWGAPGWGGPGWGRNCWRDRWGRLICR
jgi:hypothetical protein